MICIETKDEKRETLPPRHKVQSGPPGFLNSWWSLGTAGSGLSVRLDQGNVKHWADEKCGCWWIKLQEIEKGGGLSSAFCHSGAPAAEVSQWWKQWIWVFMLSLVPGLLQGKLVRLEPGLCRWDFVVVCFSPEIYRFCSLIEAKATSVRSGKHLLHKQALL